MIDLNFSCFHKQTIEILSCCLITHSGMEEIVLITLLTRSEWPKNDLFKIFPHDFHHEMQSDMGSRCHISLPSLLL